MFHSTTEKVLTERQQRIFDFIKSNRTGVLASVDPDNEPHGSVIYHAINENFHVFFLTKKDTNKYLNLVQNSSVVLVIYEPITQTVAHVIGKAHEMRDDYAINQVASSVLMASLHSSRGGIPPIAKLDAGEYAAFKIEPEQIVMASYLRPDSGEYDQVFESIESFELKIGRN